MPKKTKLQKDSAQCLNADDSIEESYHSDNDKAARKEKNRQKEKKQDKKSEGRNRDDSTEQNYHSDSNKAARKEKNRQKEKTKGKKKIDKKSPEKKSAEKFKMPKYSSTASIEVRLTGKFTILTPSKHKKGKSFPEQITHHKRNTN